MFSTRQKASAATTPNLHGPFNPRTRYYMIQIDYFSSKQETSELNEKTMAFLQINTRINHVIIDSSSGKDNLRMIAELLLLYVR